MTSYEKRQNEKFIIRIIQYSSVWVWTDISESYKVENNKLKPTTKRGEVELKKIVSDEFFRTNIITFK
jgi:hypothetical protein